MAIAATFTAPTFKYQHMKKIVSLCITAVLFIYSENLFAQAAATVSSPDKSITAIVQLKEGSISYTIKKNGTTVIEPSSLGITMSDVDFSKELKLISVSKPVLVIDSYETLTAKKKNIQYKANKVIVSLKNTDGRQMDIIFSISNDGVAFRYYFPWLKNEVKTITAEHTTYIFNKDAKAWLQPMSVAKTGWEQCHPSYEEHYLQNIPVGTPTPLKAGWVYPALFQTNNDWVLITEAALDGTYCGTRLENDSASSVYHVAFPDPREVFTGKGYLPQNNQPWYSPWRIITIGSLKTIAESTLGTDLSPKAIAVDPSFIKPGKASWSWINSKDDFIVYDEQVKYIDYAADMHWQYCLIDADWDTKIGYDKIKELSAYAKSKNVGLLLWYNSAGAWNTVKYHPKDLLLTHESREKEFSRLEEMGIKGVKIDFFGGDGSSMIQYYIDILNDAAKHHLLVNFHGATLPRGWAKTYPHLMTTEAIYGMEMVTFDQRAADAQPNHCAMLPFTRNAFDPMDFTPMNLYKLTYSKSIRRTTSSFELALSVLFLSGIQHYAENPGGMSHVPAYVKEFLRTLPNSWDDVKFIDGYPGKYAIIARKSGDKWYVAAINGENADKKLSLDLSALKKMKGTIISEGEGTELFQQKELQLSDPKKVSITLKANGGFVMTL